jgi:hypothetical protein
MHHNPCYQLTFSHENSDEISPCLRKIKESMLNAKKDVSSPPLKISSVGPIIVKDKKKSQEIQEPMVSNIIDFYKKRQGREIPNVSFDSHISSSFQVSADSVSDQKFNPSPDVDAKMEKKFRSIFQESSQDSAALAEKRPKSKL